MLLEGETRHLSVLRSISRSIPPGDRWRSVFDRYLAVLAGRVRGFGGNPDAVLPSPDGGLAFEGPSGSCPPEVRPGDLFCLNIPWNECDIEGELHLRLRFKRCN